MVFLAHQLEISLRDKEESTGVGYGDILFITNEMGEEEIKERLDCIKFRLPYERFLKGSLTEREKNRYYRGLDGLKKKKSKIRILYSCQTIDELTTYVGLYKPSAVFIDGSYLMESKMAEGWERIVYITRNLKQIAKNFKVPIIRYYVEYLQNLIKHFTMLAGYTHNRLKYLRILLKFFHQRSHFNGFGTSPEDQHYFLHKSYRIYRL